MLLNMLQCKGQPPTTKNYPAKYVSGVQVKKSCLRVIILIVIFMSNIALKIALQFAKYIFIISKYVNRLNIFQQKLLAGSWNFLSKYLT